MSINRHNYEEYFILYMDNELSAGERKMVENFVQQHTDLKEELDTLLQYKLVPDTHIIFERKEELMFPESKSILAISQENFSQWLVLYIDNELSEKERSSVEAYIKTNEAAKAELNLLQRTKLQPENIQFRDKRSLYRSAEKVRVLPMRWRVAAAAVLLIGIGLTAILMVNRKSNEPELVKIVPTEQKAEAPLVNNKEPQPTEDKVADLPVRGENSIADQSVSRPNQKKELVAKNISPVIEKKQPVVADVVKENAIANVPEKQGNDLPQPIDNPYLKEPKKNDAIASNNPVIKNEKKDALTNPIVTTEDDPTLDIIQAAHVEPEKKNKLRGLFRKVARTLDKRTGIDATDDNNKLLVAGLSIKLK